MALMRWFSHRFDTLRFSLTLSLPLAPCAVQLGAGWSTSRRVGEILTNSYACFPDGSSGGVEMVLSARASVPNDSSLVAAQHQLQVAVAAITNAVLAGVIE